MKERDRIPAENERAYEATKRDGADRHEREWIREYLDGGLGR